MSLASVARAALESSSPAVSYAAVTAMAVIIIAIHGGLIVRQTVFFEDFIYWGREALTVEIQGQDRLH